MSTSEEEEEDEGQLCDESLNPCEGGYQDCGYKGCQTLTVTGNECQAWDCWKSPDACVHTGGHLSAFEDEWDKYVDNFGLGPHSFCRNPDGEDTIWCYTKNESVRWEYCEPAPRETKVIAFAFLLWLRLFFNYIYICSLTPQE